MRTCFILISFCFYSIAIFGTPLFLVTFDDPYAAHRYQIVLSSGMAVIPAANRPFQIAVTEPQAGAVFALSQTLQQNNVVVQHVDSASLYLILPDTGGTYRIRYGPPGNGAVELVLIVPKKLKITSGKINGYVMGNYPMPGGHLKPPERFIEITPDLLPLALCSNLTIEDFTPNSYSDQQQKYFPKYAVIRYPVIFKVETLINVLAQQPQFNCKGIRVSSGYRTPAHNHATPESVRQSYHIYGLAVDLIVDANPRDGVFDDVNKNGKSDLSDPVLLAKACDYLEKNGMMPIGGVGVYEYRTSIGNPAGPGAKDKYSYSRFVHIDAREVKRARWGYWYRDGRKMGTIGWR